MREIEAPNRLYCNRHESLSFLCQILVVVYITRHEAVLTCIIYLVVTSYIAKVITARKVPTTEVLPLTVPRGAL